MVVRLIESLGTTEALAQLFSDESILRAMLDFEAALARAEAHCGIIPASAADAITSAATLDTIAADTLPHDIMRAGTPGIPLVKALTKRVREHDRAAAGFVHWGATSQDVADTARILILKKTQPILEGDIARLESGLRRLAGKHENTVMLGRTLMQPAPPVTFGLKAAGWLGAIERTSKHLEAAFAETLIVQFGGASGTLASLGTQGIEVGRALAKELDLDFPDAPWHSHRDRLGFLISACGVLTGSLGKMARDISLLMQSEIAEVAEPAGDGRGGSSTMPQKRNPIGCSLTLAAAQRVPGLVSSFLSGMIQEHERGVGGWQAEWPTIAATVQATGMAVASMAEVAQGLTVDEARMRANIDATRGAIFAEKAMMVLGQKLGRDVAHKLLEEATRKAAEEGRHLAEILGETPEIAGRLDVNMLRELEIPEKYLGVSNEFRKRLLGSSESHGSRSEKE